MLLSGATELVLYDAPHMTERVTDFNTDDAIGFAQFASGDTTISKIVGTGKVGTTTDVTPSEAGPGLGSPISATLSLFNRFDDQYGLAASSYALNADGQAAGGTLFQLEASLTCAGIRGRG